MPATQRTLKKPQTGFAKKHKRVRGKEPFAITMDKGGKARVWYRKRDM